MNSTHGDIEVPGRVTEVATEVSSLAWLQVSRQSRRVVVAIGPVVAVGAADLRHTNAFHSGICGNVCPSPEFSEGACCLTCWCMPFTFARIRRVEFGDNYWTMSLHI